MPPSCADRHLVDEVVGLLGLAGGQSFARGSTGLFALFSALREMHGPGEVIVPSLCCEAVALSVVCSGHAVRFADVSSASLCVTPETVAPLMTDRTRAVVVVHLYGVDADTLAFNQLRRGYPRAVFVEDIAHAFGGKDAQGHYLGTGLDYSLLSFAESKIVPGEGGLLLHGPNPQVDPMMLAKQIPRTAPFRPSPELSGSLRNLVHAVADLWRTGKGGRVPAVFSQFAEYYRDLVVLGGRFEAPDIARRGVAVLDANTRDRYNEYLEWCRVLDFPGCRVLSLHSRSTCWRCPVVFDSPDRALSATRALREAGFAASNHYFPLSILFGASNTPKAEAAALSVLNLWTDGSLCADAKAEAAILIKNSKSDEPTWTP